MKAEGLIAPAGRWSRSSGHTNWRRKPCICLHGLIPLPARPRESLPDLVTRVEPVQARQHEIDKTKNRLAKERQFKCKVETHAELRKLKTELEGLKQ